MNNRGPIINPFFGFQNNEQNDYSKLVNKINRLEKDIRILQNRIDKIEKVDSKPNIIEEPTDMYMI